MATRHIYIFALHGNLLDELRREISSTLSTTAPNYVPEIIVNDAIDGIAKIELVNFRESAVLIPFWSFQIEIGGITSLQIELKDINNSNNHSIETEEDSIIFECGVDSLEIDGVIIDEIHRLINLSTINHNARLYIRFPVFLNEYGVNIRIRCKLITSDSWSAWTQKQIINISPSIITKKFKINEIVSFAPTHSNHKINGKIIQIIDPQKDLYSIQTGTIRHRICNNIHSSRIYRTGPHLKHIIIDIDKSKQMEINKQLLFGMYGNNEYDDIFNILSDIYYEYAERHCDDFKSIQHTDYIYIGRYIANNVMDFILDIENINLLKCIMNLDDGIMRLVPVWHSSLINHIELLEYHRNSDIIIVNPTEMNTKFSCDLCGIEISEYEWIYKCNGCNNVLNKHFICLICGYHIITQHSKIQQLLIKYLNKYLYIDIIKLIATFICGSVITAN